MKSPTNYGSENEETRFIRRVAAPDRPSNKRRQKKRLAMAGATLGLLAASAGVGYTAMKNAGSTSTAVKTANLKADMSSEARSFVSKLGDAFENPNFNKIDKNRDGELSLSEILDNLSDKEEVDVDKVKNSDLPNDIKKKIVALLEGKLKSDDECAKQALDQREAAVTKADHEIFYYLLDVFCPRITIAVTPPGQEEEEEPLDNETQQTVEIPTPNGETAQVIIVGEPEDGKQTIAIPDDQGGYTTTEVRSIETPSGEQKILIPNAQGDITPVVVPEIPVEISEATKDIQVVDVVDSTGETEQVIIEGEPEYGEQKVEISDGEGGYTETEAKVEETPDGEELIIENHGEIIRVDEPGRGYYDSDREAITGPGGIPVPEPPALQTVDIVADNGEHEQVVLVGGVEDGKQTVEIANEYGGFTTEEVKAVETAEGEKLVIEDAQGQSTVVEVHDLPAEVAATVTEDSQIVNAVTEDNQQVQIVVEGEPEHGKQTVQIIDEHGDVTVEQATAIETSEGVKLEVETDEGPVAVVVAEVPEEIKQEVVEEQEEHQPGEFGGNPFSEEEPAALQTLDIVADNGEHEQVVLVGGVEDGKQTVEIANEYGGFTTEEVKAVETAEGEKLVIEDAQGQSTVVEVHDLPAEVAATVTEDSQIVNAVTEDNQQVQIVVEGEPEHGKQTVQIIDEHGDVTVEQATAIETSEGVKLEVETDEGPVAVVVAEVPEEIKQEVVEEQEEHQPGEFGGNPFSEEEPAALQTLDIVADNGEHEQVVLVGGVEDGKQTVEIANEYGGFTTEEVKAVETAEGEKLVIEDAQGQSTVVEVHDLPAEVAATVTEDSQIVNAVTEDNQQVQIVVEGEPEHGKQTVQIIDEHGDVTVEQATAIETSEGVKLEVETDEGPVAVVVAEVPEEIKQEVVEEQEEHQPGEFGGNPFSEEEPAALQTLDIVADNGEHEQVVLVGGVEDGKQTVEIANEYGGFTTEEVKAVETAEGEKLVIEDAQGQSTVVEVHDLPAEVAATVTEDSQIVNAVTEDNQQVQIVVEGEPEHGKQTVQIIDEHGDVTVEQATAIETSEGVKLEVETDEGPVAVVVAEVPEEIKQEVVEEQEEHQPGEFGGNPFSEEEPAALQTLDIVADNGEHEQVVLVGGVEDGKQTVEIANEYGGFTTEEVKAVETAEGEKLVIEDAQGQSTVVEVHDLPAEVAATVTEDSQIVNAVTEDNQQVQIVVEGEPEHGKQTVQIIDEHGDVTVEQATAIETSEGVKLEVETDEGPVAVVVAEVPEEIKQEVVEEQEEHQPGEFGGNPFSEEEPAALQTLDIVADNGEHEQVVLVGGVEDGKQTVEIANEYGGFTTEEVKAVETAEGEKLVIEDAQGQSTVVEVHDLPAEVAATVTEDSQIVNAVTEDNQQVQIVVEGEPEHGKQTVQIIDEHGDVTVEQATAIETSEGVKLEVETDEGPVAVVVAEVPEEIKQEVVEEQEEHQPGEFGGNPFSEEEPAALQTLDIVADNGEHEQVVLVGGVEDGKQTVEIANEYGGFTTEEVKAVETAEGEKLVIEDAQGQSTVVEVHDLPAEVAATVTEDSQIVNAVTEDNQQVQIVVEGEPEHGKQTVQIIDEHGDVTVEQATAIETSEGVKLEVETDEGPVAVVVAEVPEEIKQEVVEEQEEHQPGEFGGNPFSEEEPAALQTLDIVADNGEHEQVVLVGGVEDGKQTVEIANEYGGFTTEEVKAVETAEGEKLVIEDAQGQSTVVEVHDLPAEVAATVTEDSQIVNAVTEDNQQVQIVVEGEPEHGKQTVQIIDEHGDVTVEQATAIETSEGVKLEVETDEGPVAVVVAEVPEEIKQEVVEEQEEHQPGEFGGNPFSEEEPAALQTLDIVADNGEHEQVVLVGGVEDGKQTVEIANEYGGFTTEEVKAVETAEGEKLVIEDAQGQSTVVEVHDLPAEVAATVTEDSQIVNAVTEDNQQVQIVVEGEPEHGKQTVQIIDEHGDVTVEQATAIETSEGVKLEVETDEGPVAVVVAEVPEEIKQEVVEEQEEHQPGEFGGNPFSEEEPAALQTLDIVADNGEHEQVVLVGGVEDGKQTVEIANEYGGFTTEEVKAVETAEGEKLVIEDAQGQSTVVEVHDLPAEVAATVTEDSQIVNAVTEDNQQVQIVVEGEPEHGKQTVQIIDEHGDVTVEQATAIETSEGVKLEVETDEGPVAVVVAEVPEEIKQEVVEEQEEHQPGEFGGNPFSEEEPAALQTLDIVADNGEHEQVVLVGGVEDGKQTVEIANEYGGFTTEEVKAVETAEGEKLVIEDAQGQSTVVEVHDLPAEVAATVTEDSQIVNAVTEDNQQVQIVVEGEPEHGKQTVQIIDEHGDVTVEQATAIETSEGVKLEVETDEGPVAVVVAEVPEEIKQEVVEEQEEHQPGEFGGNPFSEEEPAALQTLDIVADNGEHEQVVLVGGVEDGKQTVEIANEYGGFTTEEVKAVETAEGEKLVIEDAQGQSTVVEVHDLPAEVAATVTEDSQIVNAVTEDNQQVQIVVEGEPEHGKQTVQIIDEHGDVTVEQATAIETSEGVKLEVETDEGPVAVVVAEVPEEIKQEVVEEQNQDSEYMTKPEFHDWIKKHYVDRLETLKVEEQKLEEEERSQAGRVKGLEDCIEQAANKFGYYGVYEQPPYYQNAVDWVENECWTAQQWEPETPHERPNLRR